MLDDNFTPVLMKLSSIHDAIADFLVSIDDKSKETKGTYQRALREFTYFFASDRRFQFRVGDVERYKEYLSKTKKLKPVSISTYLTALRRFCQYLVERGILEKNPAKKVQGSSRPQTHSRHFLTLDEVDSLLASIETSMLVGLRDRALILTMLGCACSEIELSSTCVGDVKNIGKHHVLFVRSKGKTSKTESIIIPKQTFDAIQEYLQARSKQQLPEDAALFASYSNRTLNKSMSARGMREAITLRLKAADIKKGRNLRLTPFSLRHTAGILMAENGYSVEQIMERMRIEWRPTAMIYMRQKGKLRSQDQEDSTTFMNADVNDDDNAVTPKHIHRENSSK